MGGADNSVGTSINVGQIKEQLTVRKQQLEEELTRLGQEKISDDQVQDAGDQAFTSTMESLRTSLHDTRLEEYKRIVNALKMIDDGSYGICIDCQEAISEKRLKAFPNATRCLACQETFEESASEIGA
jgi:DnaK suppressor protein